MSQLLAKESETPLAIEKRVSRGSHVEMRNCYKDYLNRPENKLILNKWKKLSTYPSVRGLVSQEEKKFDVDVPLSYDLYNLSFIMDDSRRTCPRKVPPEFAKFGNFLRVGGQDPAAVLPTFMKGSCVYDGNWVGATRLECEIYDSSVNPKELKYMRNTSRDTFGFNEDARRIHKFIDKTPIDDTSVLVMDTPLTLPNDRMFVIWIIPEPPTDGVCPGRTVRIIDTPKCKNCNKPVKAFPCRVSAIKKHGLNLFHSISPCVCKAKKITSPDACIMSSRMLYNQSLIPLVMTVHLERIYWGKEYRANPKVTTYVETNVHGLMGISCIYPWADLAVIRTHEQQNFYDMLIAVEDDRLKHDKTSLCTIKRKQRKKKPLDVPCPENTEAGVQP